MRAKIREIIKWFCFSIGQCLTSCQLIDSQAWSGRCQPTANVEYSNASLDDLERMAQNNNIRCLEARRVFSIALPDELPQNLCNFFWKSCLERKEGN
jgi:hypothetical protein